MLEVFPVYYNDINTRFSFFRKNGANTKADSDVRSNDDNTFFRFLKHSFKIKAYTCRGNEGRFFRSRGKKMLKQRHGRSPVKNM